MQSMIFSKFWSRLIGDNSVMEQRQLFIENATDERAHLHFNNQDDVPRITTNRPRTIGLRVSYDL